MKKASCFAVLCLFLLLPTTVLPASVHSFSKGKELDRLVDLCRLWGKVKYFHPYLAYRSDIEWDDALVEAIPKVREAEDPNDFKLALQQMLDRLGDPLTRVADASSAADEELSEEDLKFQKTEDGILVITVGDYFSLSSPKSQTALREITALVPASKAIVFDLRSSVPIGDYGTVLFNIYFGGIERSITTEALSMPGDRSRVHYGYENFSPSASGQYKSGMFTMNNRAFVPIKNAKNIPVVFVLNRNGATFESLSALQRAGKGLVVLGENDAAIGKASSMDLGNGLTAEIRTSEAIFEDGTDGSILPDLIAQENPVESAIELARNFRPSKIVRRKIPLTSVSYSEKAYPEMKFPSPEYRLLAAFRIWNVVEYFYAYKDLLGEDWESVLREFIPRFKEAGNELEYTLTVAEMVTRIEDSHAYLNSSVFNEFLGTGYPPIRVRLIEGRPIVTALYNEEEAKLAGILVGDEVIGVEGEDALTRLERYARYISASTVQSKMDKASLSFMNGKPESLVTLIVRSMESRKKTVRLKRRFEDYRTLYHRERNGEILGMLPGNIGYADLDRLTVDRVDEMLEKFKDLKAIIFDMRGYPNGVAWAVAARLTSDQSIAALFETPMVGHNLPSGQAYAGFYQKIDRTPAGKSVFKGKTVMLIDERAASQAEHTGMLFRAANGTLFVGSRTSGVNGEITTFRVPGAITIGFTGQAVRFPDGRELQKVGLVPDVEVKPTRRGIAEGRDEILERAVEFINGTP